MDRSAADTTILRAGTTSRSVEDSTAHIPQQAQQEPPSAAPRRSSPFVSPAGTLRTVREEQVRVVSPLGGNNGDDAVAIPQAQREESFESPRRRGTPTAAAAVAARRRSRYQVTYEDLISRPRSNPRSRTPMRYESPLEHGAFRRETAANGNNIEDEERASEARTISIRSTAGLGVGVVRPMPQRTHFDDTNQRPQPIVIKSMKQGPGKRKTRRYNNDNFSNCHSDLVAHGNAKSRAAAEILAKAKADARHFLPVYDPADNQRSEKVTQFMEEPKYQEMRDSFFRGELHASNDIKIPQHKTAKELVNPTAQDLFQRIDPRLRRVVTKAIENSAPACRVINLFETYLLKLFDPDNNSNEHVECDFWEDLLLEPPTLENKTITLLFDAESSSGGFHRLLVHALCQFHGLQAKTSTQVGSNPSRVLSIQFGAAKGTRFRLVDLVEQRQEQKGKETQERRQ